MLVIGGGATGAQVASIFNAFGSRVQLFQAGRRILPTEDEDVSAAVAAAFRESGIVLRENFGDIESFEKTPSGVRMIFAKDGLRDSAEAALAVVAVGWVANAAGLSLATAGVETNQRGFVGVDAYLRTSAPHIFAAGDITGRLLLVPEAIHDGFVAATNVLSSMLAMGLGLTVSQIIAPLRNTRLVVLSLLVNFVLMPLGAVALAALLRLDQPLGVGLLLLGAAAGAPFLPKLAQIARGNLAFAVGLMVLLMVVTVGYLPLVLPLLLPGVSVNPAKIARSLFLLMLLPLAGALAVKARFADIAARTKPLLDRLSNLSLILLVLLITAGNVNNVLAVFGTRGILAGLLFIAIGFVIGWLLGGPDRNTRRVLALGSAQRNIAAALVVGSQSFSDPKVVVMVVVVAIVSLLILMPLSRMLAKRD